MLYIGSISSGSSKAAVVLVCGGGGGGRSRLPGVEIIGLFLVL